MSTRIKELEIGDELQNGAIVIARKPGIRTGDAMVYIVLALRKENKHDPFVVWTAYAHPEYEKYACQQGDYYTNLPDAARRFEERSW